MGEEDRIGTPGFRSHTEIVAQPTPPKPIAIEGILSVGDLAIITAPRDTFKSTFAAELAYALSTGRPLFNCTHFETEVAMNVGLLQVEVAEGNYDARLASFSPTAPRFYVRSAPFTFDELEAVVYPAVAQLRLDALIFDPIGQMWPERATTGEAFRENEKAHVSPLLRELKSLGLTIILVHHDPKPAGQFRNRASGSASLLNDPDVRIYLDKTRMHEVVRVEVENRLQSPAQPFHFRYQHGRLHAVGAPGGEP